MQGGTPCKDATHLFYSDVPAEQRAAKDLCFACPFQLDCLAEAVQRNEKYGIWGGTLPAERRRIK